MDISLQHEHLQEYLQSAATNGNMTGPNPLGLGPNGSALFAGLDKNGTEVTITAPASRKEDACCFPSKFTGPGRPMNRKNKFRKSLGPFNRGKLNNKGKTRPQ
uniref:Uncharacterized protein n=1 Tax=Anopheles maculatus TaxID=74869 RepID=A0A182S8Q1_9DIPT